MPDREMTRGNQLRDLSRSWLLTDEEVDAIVNLAMEKMRLDTPKIIELLEDVEKKR